MYIKEIKLNSFKSFADKVSLNLDSTFTGIVGPNGSGKSNIVDAIKWVLGEQSVKTLRASEGMTDVIFSGSKSRNPSNQASVTIVFDNTDKSLPVDFSEVSIKRVVYKNGENEYFLNNERCRLKDITDLFIDSFSSKESINIIQQNKIEEILSEKAEDRRSIFEEASGTLKYKKRKEEALKRLSKTHENIDRVNMIIAELAEAVTPLEIASKKALKYKEAKSKLENVEIALIVKDISTYSSLLNDKKYEKEKLDLEIIEKNKNSSIYSNDIEKLKLESIKLEEEIKEIRDSLLEKKELLSSLLREKELAVERSKYDKNDNNIKTNLVSLKDNSLKLEKDINVISKEILDNKELYSSLLNKEKFILEKKENINKKLISEKENYQKLKKKEFEIFSSLNYLKDSVENMSKVPYAVKAVLNNPMLKGICNIVGNIVSTSNEYMLMLDVALSASANYIVTEDETSSKNAISYLKSSNKGRATFFPISVITPKAVDRETLEYASTLDGYIGIVSSLTNYDEKYKNIVLNLLGNIIVVDNIDNAVVISKKINHRYRIVTLTGEILHVGGSLTGGSNKLNSSTISEKIEIESLNKTLEQVKKNIKEREEEINKLELSLKENQDEELKQNIEKAKINEILLNKTSYLSGIKEEYNKVLNEIKDLSSSSEISKVTEELMEKYYKEEEEYNILESKLKRLESERSNVLDLISEKEISLKKVNSNNSEIVSKINNLEIEIVKLNMNLDNLLNRLNDEYTLTYEGAKDKYELTLEESQAREIVQNLRREIKSIGNVNLDSIEEYERVNKRYTFLISQREDLLSSEKDILQIIDNMDNVMAEKFIESFNKINKEFEKVFKELFKGGEAHLELTAPEKILETGIEIIAVPPGKVKKSISLLSGGEKTLTAISLLFAIMNLKKVPFVILDEVESALDEVNAEIFGNYITNYRGRTQLLIITHKKKTMEFVDLLYGITMQESGVSKLVSVKLEDIK